MRIISTRDLIFEQIKLGRNCSCTYVRMSYQAREPISINAQLLFTDRHFSLTCNSPLPIIGESINIEINPDKWESNTPHDGHSSIYQDIDSDNRIKNIEVELKEGDLCVCIETIDDETLDFFSL